MTVLIDSWAWIEYFKGSDYGIKAKSVIESGEQLLVSSINISEIYHFFLRHKMDANNLIKFVLDSSFVIPLDTSLALRAANIKFTKKLGMADAIVIATAEENNAKILTGDDDFKNIKNVIYIGK